jgi:hypothetical protein
MNLIESCSKGVTLGQGSVAREAVGAVAAYMFVCGAFMSIDGYYQGNKV